MILCRWHSWGVTSVVSPTAGGTEGGCRKTSRSRRTFCCLSLLHRERRVVDQERVRAGASRPRATEVGRRRSHGARALGRRRGRAAVGVAAVGLPERAGVRAAHGGAGAAPERVGEGGKVGERPVDAPTRRGVGVDACAQSGVFVALVHAPTMATRAPWLQGRRLFARVYPSRSPRGRAR
jgi:hypothetical protein